MPDKLGVHEEIPALAAISFIRGSATCLPALEVLITYYVTCLGSNPGCMGIAIACSSCSDGSELAIDLGGSV